MKRKFLPFALIALCMLNLALAFAFYSPETTSAICPCDGICQCTLGEPCPNPGCCSPQLIAWQPPLATQAEDGFSFRAEKGENVIRPEFFPWPEELYECKVLMVVDGDTVEGDVYLPFSVTLRKQRIRFLGIDTWEVTGPDKEKGEKATAHTKAKLKAGTLWISPEPGKDRDNFGRILAYPWIEKPDGSFLNLAEDLSANGHDKE